MEKRHANVRAMCRVFVIDLSCGWLACMQLLLLATRYAVLFERPTHVAEVRRSKSIASFITLESIFTYALSPQL